MNCSCETNCAFCHYTWHSRVHSSNRARNRQKRNLREGGIMQSVVLFFEIHIIFVDLTEAAKWYSNALLFILNQNACKIFV